MHATSYGVGCRSMHVHIITELMCWQGSWREVGQITDSWPQVGEMDTTRVAGHVVCASELTGAWMLCGRDCV